MPGPCGRAGGVRPQRLAAAVCGVPGAPGEPNPLCAGELVLDIDAGVDYNMNVAFAIVAELAYAHV